MESFRTTLARFRAAQLGTLGGKDRRPYLASECKDLKECERWRREILREISKKVTQIQNGNFFLSYMLHKSETWTNNGCLIFCSWTGGIQNQGSQ